MAFAGEELFVPFENVEAEHLALEARTTELFSQDGLIDRLQLVHGKTLGKEVASDQFSVEVFAQRLQGFLDDFSMVEDQSGQFFHIVPSDRVR